jgi:hypothetical protein
MVADIKQLPRVPTDEMKEKAELARQLWMLNKIEDRTVAIYQAMYDAAPEPIEESWGDVTDEFTEAINAAHPCETENYEDYAKAHSMVSNRHSKSALVDLVNWLLVRENLSNNPENLYTSGECVKETPDSLQVEPTKETGGSVVAISINGAPVYSEATRAYIVHIVAERDALKAELREAVSLVKALSDDCRIEIEHRYNNREHPVQKRRYEQDMCLVYAAEAFLSKHPDGQGEG